MQEQELDAGRVKENKMTELDNNIPATQEDKTEWGKHAWLGVFILWIIPAASVLIHILGLIIIFIVAFLNPSVGDVPELPFFLAIIFIGLTGAFNFIIGFISFLFAIVGSIAYMICWIVYMIERDKK